jgi:hypothetical protein
MPKKREIAFQAGTFAVLIGLVACGGGGGDQPVSGENFPVRDNKYNMATAYYGPLVVREGEIFAQASTLPWTGYWLPSNNTYMFQGSNGSLSPLEKYDQYMKKAHGTDTQAAQYEHDNNYNPLAGPADGHCDAWSIASIYENDPTPGGWQSAHNATLNGVTFTPGDLKALLVDTYENQNLVKMFGEKYQDDHDDFDDIYPDQFQAVLQAELFGKNHTLVMDRDPGPDVWNTPIYSADIQTKADSSDAHLLHVTAYIGTVNAIDEFAFGQDPNWEGDPTLAEYTEIYTYDLYGDRGSDGNFTVKSGVWTGDSLTDHPDFVLVKVDGATDHSSKNVMVTNDIVYEIINRAGQTSN